ncbi:L-2-hydroxyglutarate oxidase [Paraneptunicella aestuarii]|uniref:L-2-hydroxyglutarate oxidase n=1 Tax=Paraneptunicella aestuarii TaxID=2831148 RepID=UPI001E5DD815|nr:L-2-hydroxyglutarate oxidase [Paraneptunicella aestuarii]UAA40499.1 L-2-hydroxyglutarate oxidase [Paraneptunicella aestuarii]
MEHSDICIVGGGIVGAATALKLQQAYPDKRIVLLDKESSAARHQTGRNSGVIHAGVYYPPGSLKAQYCREGLQRTIQYCQQYHLPYDQCGKLLVATNELEMERMQGLYQRCLDNELSPELLDAKQLKQREPNITGLGAIWVKDTGIVDYVKLTEHMLQQFQSKGGVVKFNTQVTDLVESNDGIKVHANGQVSQTGFLVNCAGLQSDRLIAMLGLETDFEIVPFRGEYYLLAEKHNQVVNHLIYPIPDPELPFLGVHLTRMIDGTVTVGPNAVLALGREAYAKTDVNIADVTQMMRFPGMWPMLKNNLKSGLNEMKNSLFKSGYLSLVQKYCPSIEKADLLPYRSGIRAQAVSKTGQLIHDFKFVTSTRSLHVGNAPSPAATSAMPIADAIYDKCAELM